MQRKHMQNLKALYLAIALTFVFALTIKFSSLIVFAKGTETDPYTDKSEFINALVVNVKSMLTSRGSSTTPLYYNPASDYVEGEFTLNDPDLNTVYDLALAHVGTTAPNQGDYIRENLGEHGKGVSTTTYGHYEGETFVATDAVYEVTFSAEYLADDEATVISTLNDAVTSLNLSGKSDYEIAKAVYDYVRLNVTYDYSALHIPDGETPEQKKERMKKHSTYAAAIDRKSVCQGYASMLYYMMLKAGVNCRIVTGTAIGTGSTAEAHAWNLVELDGKWYNVDVTWDSDQGSDKYFLLTSETIATAAYGTHTPNVTFSGYTMATEDNPYKKDDEKNIKASLLGCALTPQDMIDVECYFDSVSWDVSGGTETTGNKVVFDIPSTPGYKQEMTYAEGNPTGSVGGKSCVVFTYRVPARCMSETITAQVVSSDGTKKSEVFRVSVKKYIDVLLEDERKNGGEKEFFKAMLYYGKYAQIYFSMNPPVAADKGYESGNPIPTMTDDIAKGYLKNGKKTDYVNVGKMMYDFYKDNTRPTSTDSNFKYHASSLVLRSQVVVRHYFELSGNATLDDYTFKSGSKTVQAFEMGGYVCVEIAFSPEEASTMTASQSKSDISVYKSSDPSTAIMSFSYNPMDYAYGVLNNSNYNTNTDLTNLLKAYMWYSVTANIY